MHRPCGRVVVVQFETAALVDFGSSRFQNPDDFFGCPDMVCDRSLDSGSRAERQMLSSEVVIHHVQRNGSGMVLDLL